MSPPISPASLMQAETLANQALRLAQHPASVVAKMFLGFLVSLLALLIKPHSSNILPQTPFALAHSSTYSLCIPVYMAEQPLWPPPSTSTVMHIFLHVGNAPLTVSVCFSVMCKPSRRKPTTTTTRSTSTTTTIRRHLTWWGMQGSRGEAVYLWGSTRGEKVSTRHKRNQGMIAGDGPGSGVDSSRVRV